MNANPILLQKKYARGRTIDNCLLFKKSTTAAGHRS